MMGRAGIVSQSAKIRLIVGIGFIWIIFESLLHLRLFVSFWTAFKATSDCNCHHFHIWYVIMA